MYDPSGFFHRSVDLRSKPKDPVSLRILLDSENLFLSISRKSPQRFSVRNAQRNKSIERFRDSKKSGNGLESATRLPDGRFAITG